MKMTTATFKYVITLACFCDVWVVVGSEAEMQTSATIYCWYPRCMLKERSGRFRETPVPSYVEKTRLTKEIRRRRRRRRRRRKEETPATRFDSFTPFASRYTTAMDKTVAIGLNRSCPNGSSACNEVEGATPVLLCKGWGGQRPASVPALFQCSALWRGAVWGAEGGQQRLEGLRTARMAAEQTARTFDAHAPACSSF
jgi:hypothetical protein